MSWVTDETSVTFGVGAFGGWSGCVGGSDARVEDSTVVPAADLLFAREDVPSAWEDVPSA